MGETEKKSLKIPKGVSMNESELKEFLENLNLWGFSLNLETIKNSKEMGKLIDETEDALYNLIFIDSILSKIQMMESREKDGPVMYRGEKITLLNAKEYKQKLMGLMEDFFAIVDSNIETLSK